MIEKLQSNKYCDKLLTPNQLAEWLQIAKSTIYKWTHTGFVPHIKIGGNVRFNKGQVERWLKRKEQRGRNTYQIHID